MIYFPCVKKFDDAELMQVLDYILNKAGLREIDALEAAVSRRRKNLARQTGVISLDPEKAAKEMTDAVQGSIKRSMEGVKNTFRNFAFDLLDKEAPGLSEEEKEKLVESWIPQSSPAVSPAAADGDASAFIPPEGYTGLAKKGKINGIPCDVLDEMVHQFVAYSLGTLSFYDEADLRNNIGDWTTVYWRKFPPQVQKLIKAFLSEKCTGEEFESVLAQMLR